MMNKYVRATVYWRCLDLTLSPEDLEHCVMLFKSCEELLNYLCKHSWCVLSDYEEISVVKRIKTESS